MLPVLITILKVILIFVCFLLGLVVLMQRPKQEGLGAAFGGSVADQILGSGTTDFLQRATVYLGVLFFVISLIIASMTAYHHHEDRIVTEGLRERPAGAASTEADQALDLNPEEATPGVIAPTTPDETTQPEPEATQPEPEATQPEPEATQPEPEVTQPEPEATQPEPEATQPEPEADPVVPEDQAETTAPDEDAPAPDSSVDEEGSNP